MKFNPTQKELLKKASDTWNSQEMPIRKILCIGAAHAEILEIERCKNEIRSAMAKLTKRQNRIFNTLSKDLTDLTNQ